MSSFSQTDASDDPLFCAGYLLAAAAEDAENDSVFFALGSEFINRGKVDEAAAVADLIVEDAFRDQLLCLTAEKCIELDDDEYATQLIDAVEREAMKEHGQEVIALAQLKKGNVTAAREIAQKVLHPDKIWAAIASSQFANGDNTAAVGTLQKIGFPENFNETYQTAAINAKESGDAEQAVAIVDNAVRSIGAGSFAKQIDLLVNAAQTYTSIDRKDKALELIKTAFERRDELYGSGRDAELVNISTAALRADDAEFADSVLDEIADEVHLAEALAEHANVYLDQGKADLAREVLDEAYTLYSGLPRYSQVFQNRQFYIENMIADEYARQGREAEATAFVKGLGNAKYRDSIASSAAIEAADAGNIESAIRLADQAVEPTARLEILRSISESNDMRDFFATELERSKDDATTSSLMNTTAIHFHKQGDVARAAELLDECYRRIDKEKPLAAALDLVRLARSHRLTGTEPSETAKSALRQLSA